MFGVGLFFVIINLFIAILWYSDYESARSFTSTALKRSIAYTAETCLENNTRDKLTIFEVFKETIKPLLIKDLNYEISLIGYHADPLYFKIKISGIKKSGFSFHFKLKEAIIEQLKSEGN